MCAMYYLVVVLCKLIMNNFSHIDVVLKLSQADMLAYNHMAILNIYMCTTLY
jgi:hypothetical protein